MRHYFYPRFHHIALQHSQALWSTKLISLLLQLHQLPILQQPAAHLQVATAVCDSRMQCQALSLTSLAAEQGEEDLLQEREQALLAAINDCRYAGHAPPHTGCKHIRVTYPDILGRSGLLAACFSHFVVHSQCRCCPGLRTPPPPLIAKHATHQTLLAAVVLLQAWGFCNLSNQA